jgi:hypothetical protein
MSLLKATRRFNIAQEMIDFQNQNFPIKLESLISEIKNKIFNKTYQDAQSVSSGPEVKKIEELVEDRLGLKIDMETDSSLAAVMPFYMNRHHVFLNDMWRGVNITDQSKKLKDLEDKKGWIDLKEAKLGGIFSTYTNTVWMNFHDLFDVYELTVGEVTGILLHELGHAFEVYEYADRIDSVNQMLATVARNVGSKDPEKKITYVYTELQKFNDKIKVDEVNKMVNGNRIIAGYYWYKYIIESSGVTSRYKQGINKYDNTSFERLADSFAGRFGYGRQVVTGLDKLSIAHAYPEKSTGLSVFYNILGLLYMLTVALVVAGVVTGITFGSILFFAFTGFLFLLTSGEDYKDYTYDELKQRYKRIRFDMVEFLKDPKVKKDEAKKVIADIHLIDQVIDATIVHWTFVQTLSNVFFSSNRKAATAIKEEQLLEDLAHNELFVKAAQFNNL